MLARWPVTWSMFWPGLASATGSGVWWQPRPSPDGVCAGAAESAGEPTSCERILALARHPSFSSVVAARVTHRLRWGELVEVWEATGELLGTPLQSRHLLNYVRLRAAVLDELELRDSPKFDRWCAHQWGDKRAL